MGSRTDTRRTAETGDRSEQTDHPEVLLKERGSRSSSQTWATFLKNQAGDIWACDFTVVYDWLFRQWYIFVVLGLKWRRIVHASVIQCPTDEWTAQQLREATAWGRGPKYLIRDRDSKYAARFSGVAVSFWDPRTEESLSNATCEWNLRKVHRQFA